MFLGDSFAQPDTGVEPSSTMLTIASSAENFDRHFGDNAFAIAAARPK